MNVVEFISHFECSGTPTDTEIIEDLESEIEDGLPRDYREFLEQCNGGRVRGRLNFDAAGKAGTVRIDAVGGGARGLWLTNRHEDYWGRIPEQLRWIASDPGGNQFLIGVDGDARGKIYFWLVEEELDQTPGASLSERRDIQLIAESFHGFLAGLQQVA
jgi:hypothetical protein